MSQFGASSRNSAGVYLVVALNDDTVKTPRIWGDWRKPRFVLIRVNSWPKGFALAECRVLTAECFSSKICDCIVYFALCGFRTVEPLPNGFRALPVAELK